MGRLFGTDGVRGTYGEDLTDDLAFRLGHAAATVLHRERGGPYQGAKILIGRDTRFSGEALQDALASGIESGSGVPEPAGVIPTAGVAYLVRAWRLDGGVVISASHNPWTDNGIKFFGPDGMKLPDALEDRMEGLLDGVPPRGEPRASGFELPGDPEEEYLAFLLADVPSLAGMRLVVDCAHGAAWTVAPEAYRRAGAEVIVINAAPDGRNINDGCGATHVEPLRRAVVERRAHAGIAHDGDADRVIAVDERGEIVDGDQILAVCALDAAGRGALPGPAAVVTTVMANLGFRQAMKAHGIEVVETNVGDRYVLEAMRARGIAMGGEQSGHVIFLDRHTTGDGILTALRLLGIVATSGRRLSELAAVSPRLPQVLIAVPVRDRDALDGAAAVHDEIARVRAELGDGGRVLVRPSGTEPVVRVMVEASEDPTARTAAERIAKAVETELG